MICVVGSVYNDKPMLSVMFCIIAYLFLLFHIIYGIFKRRKEKRKYNKAFDKYYEEMKSISLDSNTLSEEEIEEKKHTANDCRNWKRLRERLQKV